MNEKQQNYFMLRNNNYFTETLYECPLSIARRRTLKLASCEIYGVKSLQAGKNIAMAY